MPLTSYLSFTLGQDLRAVSYPVFNGMFANPVFGVGKGAFVNTLDAYNVLRGTTSKTPINYWATHSIDTIALEDTVVSFKAQQPLK